MDTSLELLEFIANEIDHSKLDNGVHITAEIRDGHLHVIVSSDSGPTTKHILVAKGMVSYPDDFDPRR